MKFLKIVSLFLLFFTQEMLAQNLHFTYLDFAPQSYNPALNGAFSGTYRGSVLFRDQYNNTPSVKGFRTIEVNIDAPIIRGFRKQDWIGVGISFDKDKAGMTRFASNFSRMGLAYHLSLDKKQSRILGFGIQFVSKNISVEKSTYNSTLVSSTNLDINIEDLFKSSGTGGNPTSSIGSSNWVLGTTYTQVNKANKLVLGASVSGIIAGQAAIKNRQLKEPFTLQAIMQYKSMLNKKILIEPTVFIQSIPSEATEFLLNSTIGLKMNEDWIVKGGLGFRTGTSSAQFLVGAEKGSLKVGLSYDAPLSGYGRASGIQNAFEIGVSYIGTINKTPKPKPTIICPRL